MMECVCICDRGLQRPLNQDRAGAFTASEAGLFYVADGIGGHYAGEKASGLVADALDRWWQAGCRGEHPSFAAGTEQLRTLLERCNTAIRQQIPAGTRSGTTIVVLWIREGSYALLSLGDSRCYLTRRHLLVQKSWQLTADDVVPQNRPNGGLLEQALGAHAACRIALRSGPLEPRTLFALCSDGIYKFCPPPLLHRQLGRANRTGRLRAAAAAIETIVRARQAPDNYSLVLVRP